MFLRGHQGHQPPDDDGEEEVDSEVEDSDEVEDNNKDDNNYKEDNNDKGISALGLDGDLVFFRTSRASTS